MAKSCVFFGQSRSLRHPVDDAFFQSARPSAGWPSTVTFVGLQDWKSSRFDRLRLAAVGKEGEDSDDRQGLCHFA